MDLATTTRIFDAYKAATEWKTDSIWLNVCMDPIVPDTVQFDFARTIGKKKKGPTPLATEKIFLPPLYNKNNRDYRKDTIAPLFATACVQAGFELIIKGWEPSKKHLCFICHRGKLHSDSARAKRPLKARTYSK